jgi:hypothetical protein
MENGRAIPKILSVLETINKLLAAKYKYSYI